MVRHSLLLTALFACCALSACKKRLKSVLPGEWRRSEYVCTPYNGDPVSNSETHFYEFREDGTGTHTATGPDGFVRELNWSAKGRKKILLDENGTEISYGVLYESTRDKQVWKMQNDTAHIRITLEREN